MKKNKTLRIAGIMLVLVLVTSCFVGGTFAKYTTGDAANDAARVAKWGVIATVEGTLFSDNYTATGANNTIVAEYKGAVDSVKTGVGDNIVAPGTENKTGMAITVTGTPEVAAQVSLTASGNEEDIFLAAGSYGVMVQSTKVTQANFAGGTYYTLSGTTYTKATAWAASTTYYEVKDAATVSAAYYPITWYVDGAAVANQAAVATAMTAYAGTYPSLTNLASIGTHTFGWEWAFEQDNAADTILGNLAAGLAVAKTTDSGDTYSSALTDGTDYNLDVKIGFTLGVTQVDAYTAPTSTTTA